MKIELISGEKLKIMLKRRGILQKDLIKQFGFNQTTISRYFTDDQQWPASFIVKVALYAGLKLTDLIEGTIEPHTIDTPYTEIDDTPRIAAETSPTYQKMSPTLQRLNELYEMMDDIRDEIDNLRSQMSE